CWRPLPVRAWVLVLDAKPHLSTRLQKGAEGAPIVASQDLDATNCSRHRVRHLSKSTINGKSHLLALEDRPPGERVSPLYGVSARPASVVWRMLVGLNCALQAEDQRVLLFVAQPRRRVPEAIGAGRHSAAVDLVGDLLGQRLGRERIVGNDRERVPVPHGEIQRLTPLYYVIRQHP